jgi:hypothetical protein
MGGSYQSALDLPGACGLAYTDARSLDEQLQAMHQLADRLFRQFEAPSCGGFGGDRGGGGGGDEEGEGGDARRRCWAASDAAAEGWGLALSGGESDADGGR